MRYAGYLNEVGEAFRPLVPEFVVYLSYVAALSYVFADTASKGKAAAEEQTGDFGCGQAAVLECLTFQMLASIIFPSFVINRWVALWGILTTDIFDSSKFISDNLHVAPDAIITSFGDITITSESITGEIPTAAGLLLIPLIVKQSKFFFHMLYIFVYVYTYISSHTCHHLLAIFWCLLHTSHSFFQPLLPLLYSRCLNGKNSRPRCSSSATEEIP